MLMQDYFKDREYPLDRIWFLYDGCRHEGNGVMIWKPEAGFHIFSQVVRSKPYPARKDIKSISIEHPVCFKMKLKNGLWAFAPQMRLDELNLSQRWVSVDCNRVFFIQYSNANLSKTAWFGTSLLEPDTNLMLPDAVLSETRIGDSNPIERASRSGIRYEDESGQKVTSYLKDNKLLEANWSLPKGSWSKANSWSFAEALKDAISITVGEDLQLLAHQSFRGKQIVTEIRAKSQPASLGILFQLMDNDIPDKDTIIQLANFLTRNSPESDVCRKIYRQVTAASQQVTFQAKELMLSTILEAALRTLYNQPFEDIKNKRSDSFKLTGTLKKFRENYLSYDPKIERRWRKVTNEVLYARYRLRDRNAHPDWLLSQGGSYSDEKLEQTMNDMILLSRFYGYMILAIAGFKNLEPVFPKPIKEWSPILTISRFSPNNKV